MVNTLFCRIAGLVVAGMVAIGGVATTNIVAELSYVAEPSVGQFDTIWGPGAE